MQENYFTNVLSATTEYFSIINIKSAWNAFCLGFRNLSGQLCTSQNALCPQTVLLDYADAGVRMENWKCSEVGTTTNRKRPVADRMMTSSMTSHDPERSWP